MAQPTPEEKLFAVIQGASHPPIRGRGSTLTLAGLSKQLLAFTGSFDLPRLNQVLLVMIVFLVGWCALTPVVMWPRVDRLIFQAQQQSVPFLVAAPLEGAVPLEPMLRALREKDPFGVGPEPVVEAPALEPGLTGPNFQAALTGLKLVGVSLSPDPTAMVEESGTQQTHVLTPGNVVGPFTVKEILPDRVILRAEGEDYVLF